MRFEKWQALGNDYLIVERDELPFELTPARIGRLCAGHFGVPADGVLLLSQPSDPANVADLRIFNPDGSEAELSGNGARQCCHAGSASARATTIAAEAISIHSRLREEDVPVDDDGAAGSIAAPDAMSSIAMRASPIARR